MVLDVVKQPYGDPICYKTASDLSIQKAIMQLEKDVQFEIFNHNNTMSDRQMCNISLPTESSRNI
jgi:hypothetical protein